MTAWKSMAFYSLTGNGLEEKGKERSSSRLLQTFDVKRECKLFMDLLPINLLWCHALDGSNATEGASATNPSS